MASNLFFLTKKVLYKKFFLGDERFLDFHFTVEPENFVISANSKSSAVFNCQFDFVRKDQSDFRIEWRKDGIPVSSIRNVGRM